MLCFYFVSVPSVKRRAGEGGATMLSNMKLSTEAAPISFNGPDCWLGKRVTRTNVHSVHHLSGTVLGI